MGKERGVVQLEEEGKEGLPVPWWAREQTTELQVDSKPHGDLPSAL